MFNFPTSYWSQASAFIRFIGEQEGGIDKLAGKKIGLIYLESGYGREPIPLFEALGKEYGYTFTTYSVPGKGDAEAAGTVAKDRPGRARLAVHVGLGRDEPDRDSARDRVRLSPRPVHRRLVVRCRVRYGGLSVSWPRGYRAGTFHATGQCCQVHEDIVAHCVRPAVAAPTGIRLGQVLYNRGVLNALFITEAVRDAVKTHGPKITGVEVRDAMESLDLNTERLSSLGFDGFTGPVKITCADHENNGPVMIQEWNGSAWNVVQTGIEPLVDVVRPMLEEAAVKEAEKFGYTMRENCT